MTGSSLHMQRPRNVYVFVTTTYLDVDILTVGNLNVDILTVGNLDVDKSTVIVFSVFQSSGQGPETDLARLQGGSFKLV
jgi:hypothetical protein